MDNYFTSFRPLIRIVAKNIRATGGLNKSMLSKYTIVVEKLLQKRSVAPLNSVDEDKKQWTVG